MAMETIFALATAPGKSGIAVIRLSGPSAWEIVERLVGDVPLVRKASLRTIRDEDGSVLDEGLVLCFREGESFTGEKSAELQVHGSVAVIRAVLGRIGATGLARIAEAGEFTRRALENERLDIAQVRGLADVIDAETELQRDAAMRVMRGELSKRVLEWRDMVLRAAALVEATIDFADEEVPENVEPEVRSILTDLLASLATELEGASTRRRLRRGFDVAIVGAPNVGKSTLLNALVGQDVAIVTEIAGTTRDLLERTIDINGLPVNLIDTAGLRVPDSEVERIGIGRALDRAKSADLRIFLYDGDDALDWAVPVQDDDLVIRSKADLTGAGGISALTGAGLEGLLRDIQRVLWTRSVTDGLVSRERDVNLCMEAADIVGGVLENDHWREELVAADLRRSAEILGGIVGGIEVEDILGEVFASFCIGK